MLAQGDGPYVEGLSALMDRVLREVAQGDDGERISRHAFRMEAALRGLLAHGTRGTLSALWEKAAAALPTTSDDLLADSLARLRAALRIDGELADCDTTLAPQIFAAAAQRVYAGKAQRFGEEVRRLIQKLSEILRADFVRSAPGRTPENLRTAFGTLHEDAFDFDAMSRLLTEATPDQAMPVNRRRRINRLLDVLQSQRFYPMGAAAAATYGFQFSSCQEALAAYRERAPEVVELARTIAMAELEIAGEYREGRHDAYFEGYSEADIDAKDLALFPDYIVTTSAAGLHAVENATLMEMLAAGLPVKVLVTTEDILDEPHTGEGHLGFGARARQLAHMAIGLNEVYVLQSSASNLYQYRDRIYRGMEHRGPALFSCYCPTGVTTPGLSVLSRCRGGDGVARVSRIYLRSRGGRGLGSAFRSRRQSAGRSRLAVAALRLRGCQPSAPLRGAGVHDGRVRGVRRALRAPFRPRAERPLVGRHDQRGRRARRHRDAHAGAAALRVDARCQGPAPEGARRRQADARGTPLSRAVAQPAGARRHPQFARGARAAARAPGNAARKPSGRWLPAPVAAAAAPVTPAAAADAAEPQPAGDDPYIETPRCTSCNECTNVNDKMFAYNENKQATIANPDAGTYAQLVEAAENCQVSIIHPGKPRNPKEPGLDALLERAKPFL